MSIHFQNDKIVQTKQRLVDAKNWGWWRKEGHMNVKQQNEGNLCGDRLIFYQFFFTFIEILLTESVILVSGVKVVIQRASGWLTWLKPPTLDLGSGHDLPTGALH